MSIGVLFTAKVEFFGPHGRSRAIWNRCGPHGGQDRLRILLETRIEVDGPAGIARFPGERVELYALGHTFGQREARVRRPDRCASREFRRSR